MNEETVRKLIDERMNQEPEFQEKYNTFLKNRGASGKLSDDDLTQVSGGFFGIKTCPRC